MDPSNGGSLFAVRSISVAGNSETTPTSVAQPEEEREDSQLPLTTMAAPTASENVLGSIERACDLQSLAYEASNAQKEHETTQGGIHDAESQPVQVDSVRTLNLLLGLTRST